MTTIKWGLIGAGDIARKRVAPAIKSIENSELYAVSRARPELAAAFAAEFEVPRWHGDWRSLVADESIDAVYIATPVWLHAEQTIAAANAGKHILCEKPMALNGADCGRMIDACKANNVKLGVAYYRRFYPVLERVRELLADGTIGKPAIAQINAFEYLALTAQEDRGWFVDMDKSGGGPMMDFGCHRIEVLTDLFGTIKSQKSTITKAVFPERNVEDSAALLLEFEDGPLASVVVTHASAEPKDTLSIYGTKGSIEITQLNRGDIKIKTKDGESKELHSPHPNFHVLLIEDFADAIINGREPCVSGSVGRIIAEIEDTIYGRA